MNEETGQGPQTIRVQNIRANRQTVKEMQVERLSVNTGDAQSAESQLMGEVQAAITAQTKTLGDALSEIENISQMQLNAMRRSGSDGSIDGIIKEFMRGMNEGFHKEMKAMASGGDGGTGGGDDSLNKTMNDLKEALQALSVREAVSPNVDSDGGGSGGGSEARGFGDALALPNMFGKVETWTNEIVDNNIGLRNLAKSVKATDISFADLLKSGAVSAFQTNIGNLGQKIQGLTNDAFDMGKVTSFATDRFNSSLDMSTTGVTDFGDAFLDFMPGFTRGGDNLVDTFNLVRTSLDSDLMSPMGIVGADLAAVSESLMAARENFRDNMGLNAMQRLSWTDANEATITLLSMEKRRDVNASLDSITTQQNIGAQLEFAQLIATNTGRTALEVIKMHEQQAKALRNYEAGGILTGDSRKDYEMAINTFADTPGMGKFAEILSGIARSGGSLELFLANNPDMATDLAASGTLPDMRALMEGVNGSGGMSKPDRLNMLMQLAGNFQQNARYTGVAGSSVMSEGGLEMLGASGMAREFKRDEDVDILTSTIKWATDVFSNYAPRAEVGMIIALAGNTAALMSNTMALGGGMLGRMFSRGKGGKGGGGGAVMGADQALAKSIRGKGGAKVGSSVLKSLVKKIPGVAIGAGLMFGAQRAMAGDWTGAGMEVASGVAATVPGLGTAASLGIDGALMARDMAGTNVASPATAATAQRTASAGVRNDTQRLLARQNRLMEQMLTEIRDQGGTASNIERNTRQSSVTPSASFWSRVSGEAQATG